MFCPVHHPVRYGGSGCSCDLYRNCACRWVDSNWCGARPVQPRRLRTDQSPQTKSCCPSLSLHFWQVASRFQVLCVGPCTPLGNHTGSHINATNLYSCDGSAVAVFTVSTNCSGFACKQTAQTSCRSAAKWLASFGCIDLIDANFLDLPRFVANVNCVAIDYSDHGNH